MSATAAKPWPTEPATLHEAIRRRAEEIYFQGGQIPGRDEQNWAQAEQEILAERESQAASPSVVKDDHDDDILAEDAPPAPHRAIIVKVNGVEYQGEYSVAAAAGYSPGEFAAGEKVPIRFVGEKMFLRRANGRELETTIIHKIG